jgi:acetylornithine deacetylase
MGGLAAIVPLLETLVAFDTVSAKSNLALIHWMRERLAALGVASELVHSDDGNKANLYATLGPRRAGGVVLSGHTDVVPVEGQAWSSDPFRLTARDGRLHGRGAADMKGFIAAVLAAVPDFLAAELKTPVHLAFSYDEEVGCLGIPRLLARLGRDLPRPVAAIIGEPTLMRVVTGHKGLCLSRTTVTGLEAHSSRVEEAVNAIFPAARIIGFLETLAAEWRQTPRAETYDPPYATLNVGIIDGGTAHNIVPNRCSFTWEFRPVPGLDTALVRARLARFVADAILPELRQRHPAATVTTETVVDAPMLVPEPGSPAESLALRLTGANRTDTIAFGTEGGFFQQSGIAAIVCGPGSIEQAHKPDEWIAAGQLEACAGFLAKLRHWASAAPGF